MQVEAVFENIAERIISEIAQAKDSIFVAVAWITNRQIFHKLVQKANEGIQINLMYEQDAINENSSIGFDQLNIRRSRVFPIRGSEHTLMHHKFCIIDQSTTITGSFNWSNKATSNYENIVVANENPQLAEKFIEEFNRIKNQYHPDHQKYALPLDKVILRLQVIKNLVELEDWDESKRNAQKLRSYDFDNRIKEILQLIESENREGVIAGIAEFVADSQQITPFEDAELAVLRLEINILQNQITAFDNDKSELVKLINAFEQRYYLELGEIILQILELRKQKFKLDRERLEDAKKDEEEYRENFKLAKEKQIRQLNENQRRELRKRYRKATLLCHPDKFSNESLEQQRLAEKMFKELNEANAKNDLERVTELLAELENGILKSHQSQHITDKDQLRNTIEGLKISLQRIVSEINEIRQSESYKQIIEIQNWDEYFLNTKSALIEELNRLNRELNPDHHEITE